MAKRGKTTAQIRAEMEKLQAELREVETREAERLGALAVKAGLHDVDATDADLIKALKDVAARFRSTPAKSIQTA